MGKYCFNKPKLEYTSVDIYREVEYDDPGTNLSGTAVLMSSKLSYISAFAFKGCESLKGSLNQRHKQDKLWLLHGMD